MKTPWLVLMSTTACGVELDLAESRFACGTGGTCPEAQVAPPGPDGGVAIPTSEDAGGAIAAPTCPPVIGRWRVFDPVAAPDRAGHGVALDGDEMLLFGGDGPNRPETYKASLDVLEPVFSVIANGSRGPYGRDQHALVFDPLDHRLYVFGGLIDEAPATNTVWTLMLNAPVEWRETAINPAPSARAGHTALLDPERHEMLVLFGEQLFNFLDDAWTLSLDTLIWSPILRGDFGPEARSDHAATFIGPDRVLMYGGRSIAGALDETWLFDRTANSWELIDFGAGLEHPGARYGHTAVFDPARYRVIIYGGRRSEATALDDAWVLNLANRCWSKVDAAGARPNPRAEHSAVFHNANMIVFGGGDPSAQDDLWALDLD